MPVQSFRVKSTGRRMRVQPSKKVPEATKQYVQKAIKKAPETKYSSIYTPGGVSMAYDSPIFVNLSAISQGDTVSSRDGDRIMPVSINCKWRVNTQSSTTVSRIIVLQWKPNSNDDVPSASKILNFGALTLDSVDYQYVPDKADRNKFTVLYDKRILQGNSQMAIGSINLSKFANKYIYYDGTDTDAKNNIYVMAFSNLNAAATEPTLYADFIFRWKDM